MEIAPNIKVSQLADHLLKFGENDENRSRYEGSILRQAHHDLQNAQRLRESGQILPYSVDNMLPYREFLASLETRGYVIGDYFHCYSPDAWQDDLSSITTNIAKEVILVRNGEKVGCVKDAPLLAVLSIDEELLLPFAQDTFVFPYTRHSSRGGYGYACLKWKDGKPLLYYESSMYAEKQATIRPYLV